MTYALRYFTRRVGVLTGNNFILGNERFETREEAAAYWAETRERLEAIGGTMPPTYLVEAA